MEKIRFSLIPSFFNSFVFILNSFRFYSHFRCSFFSDFTEFQIMRQHAKVDDNTIRYLIQTSPDADPVAATCAGIIKGKDPIKGIGTCELKVDADGNVVAINLNGDCVVKKCC